MNNELTDLLQKYADTCITLDVCHRALKCGVASSTIEAAAHGFEKDKANLESQIVELFGQAEKRGAEVERAECAKIADDYEYLPAKTWDKKYGYDKTVSEAIRERDTESGEGKQ
jgi:hypothetical protein